MLALQTVDSRTSAQRRKQLIGVESNCSSHLTYPPEHKRGDHTQL